MKIYFIYENMNIYVMKIEKLGWLYRDIEG